MDSMVYIYWPKKQTKIWVSLQSKLSFRIKAVAIAMVFLFTEKGEHNGRKEEEGNQGYLQR